MVLRLVKSLEHSLPRIDESMSRCFAGDLVCTQGDYVEAIYWVHEGLLEVRSYEFPDAADASQVR